LKCARNFTINSAYVFDDDVIKKPETVEKLTLFNKLTTASFQMQSSISNDKNTRFHNTMKAQRQSP